MLETGIKGYLEKVVAEKDTAKVHGSGTLDVFATPALVALIEGTCWKSVLVELETGMGSVGTEVRMKHLAPTPVGMKVWCESELTEVDGRRLVFTVQVHDETGKIGEGTHERFIIQEERFQSKANQKLG